MSYEFRSPNLNGQTPETQIQQILSFLRQHIQQLNWVFQNVDVGQDSTLTDQQMKSVLEAVVKSSEVFQTIYRKLKKKQAQENFVGAGKRTVLEGVALDEGVSASVDTDMLDLYTLFVTVSAEKPVLCCKYGSDIYGDGIQLTCGSGTIAVTTADSPVTAVYAII